MIQITARNFAVIPAKAGIPLGFSFRRNDAYGRVSAPSRGMICQHRAMD